MSNEIKEFFTKFKTDAEKMGKLTPDAAGGFMQLFSKIMKDGAMPLKQKELVALGIAVAAPCEPCIKLHVQKCLAAGASKEEILESASVAIMMAGGPAFTHLPVVIDTIETLQS